MPRIRTSRLSPGKRIDIAQIALFDASSVVRRVRQISLIVQNEWKNLASANLSSTATDYKNNIQVKRMQHDPPVATIILRGTVPNMMEQGMGPGGVGTYGPYDMRTFILKGRTSVTIPFDISGATISKYGFGSKPWQFKRGDSNIAGVGAFDYAKALQPGERMESNMSHKIRAAPNFIKDPISGAILVQEGHSTDALAGLQRMSAGAQQSMAKTFRKMSKNGKPWIHPGIKPLNLARKIDYGKCIGAAWSINI